MTEEELRNTPIIKAEIIDMEIYVNGEKFVGNQRNAMEIIRLRASVLPNKRTWTSKNQNKDDE